MRMTLAIIAVLLAADWGWLGAEELPQRIYAVLPMPTPPVIDGVLSDPGWQSLPETSDFTLVITGSGPAKAQTFVRLGRTDTHLYVALRCLEPKMEEVRQALKIEDTMRESVEIFIDADLDRSTYVQFRVSNGGMREARLGSGPDDPGLQTWSAGVAFEQDAWTVEAAIPFNVIGTIPVANDRWGVNFNRQRSVVGELGCWSNTGGGFHAPGKFGQIVFRPLAEWLNAVLRKDIQGMIQDAATLEKTYPVSLGSQAALSGELRTVMTALDGQAPGSIGSEPEMLAAMKLAFDKRGMAEGILQRVRLAVVAGEFR